MDSKRDPQDAAGGKKAATASPEVKAFITWAVVAIILIVVTLVLSMHRAT